MCRSAAMIGRVTTYLELRKVLDGINADDIAFRIKMNAMFQPSFGGCTSFVPCLVAILHEETVALQGGNVADLHDRHIAASAYNVTDINEVVASKSCNLSAMKVV